MDSRTINAWKSGCTRQLIIYAGLAVVMLAALVLLVVFAMVVPGPQATPDDRAGYLMWGLLIEVAFTLVVILAWGAIQIRRRAVLLDAAFAPAGLHGKPYLLNGRQYKGEFKGQSVTILFYRGPTLEITLSAGMKNRLTVGTRDDPGFTLARQFKVSPIETGDPAYRDLAVSTADPVWGRELLGDPAARELFLRLLFVGADGVRPYELRQVVFQPGAVVLRLVRPELKSITPASALSWLHDLDELVSIAEGR